MKVMVLKRKGLLMEGKLSWFYFKPLPDHFIVHIPERNMSVMCTVEDDTVICKTTPSKGPISVSEGSKKEFSRYMRDLAKDVASVSPHRPFVFCLYGMKNMGKCV